MSWVSENKFLTGFGAVMLAGLGTLGWFTWSAMGKYDEAAEAFGTASNQLKTLHQAKPSLSDAHLKDLLAQKQELTKKISEFQQTLKSHVLPVPTDSIEPAQFQDKLKVAVAQFSADAARAKVEIPKNFYLDFDRYQSSPAPKAAVPVLARELRAIQLVLDVLVKTGSLELNEFHRDPLPEEGRSKGDDQGGAAKRKNADRSDRGVIERNTLFFKLTSTDDAFRKVLTDLANHKQQLFVVRNVTVANTKPDSPSRGGLPSQPLTPAPDQPQPGSAPGAPAPASPAPETAPATPPAAPAPAAAATSAPPPAATVPAPATPAAPAPAAPMPSLNEGPLSYVFGTEKIVSTIELEVLNIEEPKEKPEKGEKKKNKEK